MKKVFLFAAVMAMGLGFTACSEDEPGGGNGNTSVTSDGNISGRLTIIELDESGEFVSRGYVTDEVNEMEVYLGYSGGDYYPAGTFVVTNGKFDFSLPTPSSGDLWNAKEYFEYEYEFENLAYSNPDAKIIEANLDYYTYMDGIPNGSGLRGTLADDASIFYCYADRDVKINGSESYTEEMYTYKLQFDINLKRGWNSIYAKESISGTTATVKYTANNEPANALWMVAFETGDSEIDIISMETLKASQSEKRARFSKLFRKK